MPIISETQQAEVRHLFEIATSGILSIIIVCIAVVISMPGSFDLLEKSLMI